MEPRPRWLPDTEPKLVAESTFTPATAPGEITRDYNAGFDRSVSMMQRATAFRQQTQLQQQQIAANEVLAPLHEATAQAQIVGAGAAIANNTRIQQLRTQAALASKPAQDEYLAATQLSDWNEQELELGRIQAKYSWMGNVPEYKGFLQTIDTARSNALKRSLLDQQIEEAHFKAETAAQARQAAAETYAASRTDVANINADSREGVAQTNADAKVARASLPTQHVFELEKMKALRDQANESGDTASAAIFDGRIKKLNNIAQSSGSAIAAALGDNGTPAATPTAPVPAPAPSPAATPDKFKVGATYKNAKGESAQYLGNGKWQPIK